MSSIKCMQKFSSPSKTPFIVLWKCPDKCFKPNGAPLNLYLLLLHVKQVTISGIYFYHILSIPELWEIKLLYQLDLKKEEERNWEIEEIYMNFNQLFQKNTWFLVQNTNSTECITLKDSKMKNYYQSKIVHFSWRINRYSTLRQIKSLMHPLYIIIENLLLFKKGINLYFKSLNHIPHSL